MTEDIYRFTLPDGTQLATGLLPETPESRAMAASYPVYGEDFYLDKADIEKLLKGDTYKTFRRLRAPWVPNQGNLGSCNAQALVTAIHNRRNLDGLPHVALSPNYVYQAINGGQDRGSLLIDGLEFSKKGIAPRKLKVNGTDAMFPNTVYNSRQVSAALMKAAQEAAPDYVSFEAYKLPVDNYETFKIATASALARDHQLVIAFHVGNSSMNLRNGYIVVGRGPGNHAVVAHSAKWVGGSDIAAVDIFNSWGGGNPDPLYGPTGGGWGEGGFGLMTMQDLYACTKYHVYYVIPGTAIKGRIQ